MAEDITPDDDLYRRVLRRSVNHDNSITSSAFRLNNPKRPDPAISVDLARLINADDCQALAGIEGLGVAMFKADVPMSMGLIFRRDPQPNNPAHCLIEGAITMAQCSLLADACVLVISPRPPVKNAVPEG